MSDDRSSLPTFRETFEGQRDNLISTMEIEPEDEEDERQLRVIEQVMFRNLVRLAQHVVANNRRREEWNKNTDRNI